MKEGIGVQIDKKTLRYIFLGIAGCILLYWVLHETSRVWSVMKVIGGVIAPFALGSALAFILNVPMRFVEKGLTFIKKEGLRRATAIVLTLLLLALVLTVVLLLLVPQLIITVESLIDQLPEFGKRCLEHTESFLSQHPELLDMLNEYTDFENLDWSELIQKGISLITSGLYSVADYVVDIVSSLVSGTITVIIGVVFCFYALARKEILARQCRRILYSVLRENYADEIIRVGRMANATFSKFFAGQCIEAVILGAMFAVTMSIFRMPYVPLVSVIISVTSLVPIVGAFVGCIVGAFLILVQDPMQAVWFVVLFLVLQQIEEHLIYPKVVGNSVGLPGMWVLFAVGVGGDLFGVVGMMVMIPIMSVLYTLAREFTNKRVVDRNIPREKLQYYPTDTSSKFKEKQKVRKEKRKEKAEKTTKQESKPAKENETEP